MSKKLFVGGLSWNTTDHDLRQAFEKFGDIEDAVIITDRDSGRSRGFGFVTFSDDSAARESISALNGTELDGRTINVNEAQEREPRSHGGGGFGGGRNKRERSNNRW
jgi:RNA recognition motif-containing protein